MFGFLDLALRFPLLFQAAAVLMSFPSHYSPSHHSYFTMTGYYNGDAAGAC